MGQPRHAKGKGTGKTAAKAGPKRGRPVVRLPLSEAREKRGLSLRDLATLSRVNHMTVWRIERGERVPLASTRRKLAAALKMEFDSIAWPEKLTGSE